MDDLILSQDELLKKYNLQKDVEYIGKEEAQEIYQELTEEMEKFDIEFSLKETISNESASKDVLAS